MGLLVISSDTFQLGESGKRSKETNVGPAHCFGKIKMNARFQGLKKPRV